MGMQQTLSDANKGIVVVLLGCTGDGKSSLGNVLLGFEPNDQENGFKTSAGLRSCTDGTYHITGKWFGMEEKPTITVVDTPGFSDGEGRDNEHRRRILETLKTEIGQVDVFLWVKRADDRLTDADNQFFQLFSKSFGEEVFNKRLLMVLTQ